MEVRLMLGPDGKWIGYGLGDSDDPTLPRNHPNWHAVSLINQFLYRKFSYARDLGVVEGDPNYNSATARAIAQFQKNAGIPVLLSNAETSEGDPVEPPYGIANLATRSRLGSYPPPPGPRHALLTFAGTWAAPGTGYPSDVAQACADIAEEIPVQAPWSFGPVPPGNIDSPSYRESVEIAVEWAVAWILAHPDRTIMLGGYSQGAEAASRVYCEFLPGGRLAHLAKNFVCGFTFGNPSRAEDSHTFYGDPAPTPGFGISTFHLPNGMPWSWIDCAAAGDVYTSTPGGPTGVIMRRAYELGVEIQLHDFLAFAGDFGENLWTLAQDAAANVGAAIDAAGRGLAFVADNPPTRPHITYQFDECLPGVTHVALAIQHVRDWGGRVEPGMSVAA